MAEAPGLRSPKLPWHFVPTYRAELWASLFIVSLLLAVVLGACIVHVSRQNAALTARVSQLEDSLQRTDGRAVTDEAAIAAAVDREVIFRGEITGLERTVLQLIDQPAASTAGAATLTLSPRQLQQLAKQIVQQLQPLPATTPVIPWCPDTHTYQPLPSAPYYMLPQSVDPPAYLKPGILEVPNDHHRQ